MNNVSQNSKCNHLKSLLKIERGEGRPLLYFLALFALLGISSAIGKASADALFLKRYGVEHLPTMYILLSIALAFFSTVYAAFVDRLSPEKFFRIILSILACVLIIFWALITFSSFEAVFPGYYLLYKLISEIIVVHAAFYLDKNLDTMQSKRLTPIILAGYQTGMILGGVILAILAPIIGVQHAPVVWLVFSLCGIGLILIWHHASGVSPFYLPPSKSSKNQLLVAIDEVRHGIGFIKQSPLLRDASYALFFMVIAYYVISFSANSIYTETFTDEAELTSFLGWLVAGTNAIALFLQIFVSNRAIEKIGVRKAKYIFPVSMLASFIAFVVNPGLIAAVASSISRESIMPAFRNPSRQMYFNVLPDYMKGRARATAVVFVMPAALLVCGVLLIFLNTLSSYYVYTLGFVSASVYLIFCYRMGKNYVSTLISNMRERLYIPRGSAIEEYKGQDQAFHDSLLQGLNSNDDAVSLSYARLLIANYKKQSIDPILNRIEKAEDKYADQLLCLLGKHISTAHSKKVLAFSQSKDEHFRATSLNIILQNPKADNTLLLEECFNSKSPRIQVTAINVVLMNKQQKFAELAYKSWLRLFTADTKSNIAVLDLIPLLRHFHDDLAINNYRSIIIKLQENEDIDLKIKLYSALKNWPAGKIDECNRAMIKDISHHNQKVRAAAISCLFICGTDREIESYLINALDDGHPSVRTAAIETIRNNIENPLELYLQWIELNSGTPRAQKEIVHQLISIGVDSDLLRDLAFAKIDYALKFFEASQVLTNAEDKNVEISLINITMRERSEQMIDLILMLLHPMLNTDILSVIRAGLNSKDKSHIANAREALQEIDDKHIISQLNILIEKHRQIVNSDTRELSKASVREILTWCTNINDHWLKYCGKNALTKIKLEQTA